MKIYTCSISMLILVVSAVYGFALFQQSIGRPLKIAAQRVIVGMELADHLKQDFYEWAKPGGADSQT